MTLWRIPRTGPGKKPEIMKIVIIDYGSGNLWSARKAFEKAAQDIATASVLLSNRPSDLHVADRIVLPGVGAFGDCRQGLFAVQGLVETLNVNVIEKGKPFLGICVGMQLMAQTGYEKGVHDGLGWIRGTVELMQPQDNALKVPQMGWNTLEPQKQHPVLQDLNLGYKGEHAYFVHSYQFMPQCDADIIATTSYGGKVAAIVGRDNMVGTQFHPEKSQAFGLKLINNFLHWTP